MCLGRGALRKVCAPTSHTAWKKSTENHYFWPQPSTGLFLPRWSSEVKNGFKRVLWTLNHLLGCLDDVSHRLREKIFASKNRPKVTFSPRSLLVFYSSKIQGFEGRVPEKQYFGILFCGSITFCWQRVRSWYWYGIEVWYSTLFGPRPTLSVWPTRHKCQFFPFAGMWPFWAYFFQDMVCTKWGHIPVHVFRKGVPST